MFRPQGVNTRRPLAVLALALLASLAACSSQFVYNRLDTFVPWYVRERVRLEEDQKEQLKASVRALTAWHRESQLERYSAFLREMAYVVHRPVTRSEVEAARARIDGFWNDIVSELAPGASTWLRTLTGEQLEELLESYAEDDEELEEEWCTASDREVHKRRVKGITSSTKYWIGSLTPEQRELVERTARGLRRTGCDWVESRSRWRATLRHVLASGSEPHHIDERVRDLMLLPERAWTPAYREGAEVNRQRFLDMLVALDAILTPEQRRHASRKLEKLAREFEEWASQGRS